MFKTQIKGGLAACSRRYVAVFWVNCSAGDVEGIRTR